MKTFKNFNEFFISLIESIDRGKDVYVFGYALEDDTDYQLETENNIDSYYVHRYIDIAAIQEQIDLIFIEPNENENIHAVLDYAHADEGDYKRLFIFESE